MRTLHTQEIRQVGGGLLPIGFEGWAPRPPIKDLPIEQPVLTPMGGGTSPGVGS